MAFLVPKNNAYSTLFAGMTATATTLQVASGEGTRFPSTFPFHISIDSEIMECSARTTDTFTVSRASESTAAATHLAGAAVRLNITAQAITELQTSLGSSTTHSTLTTGIHGVGTKYIAKSTTDGLDLSDHDSRHSFGGADEISPYGLMCIKPYSVMFSTGSSTCWTKVDIAGTGSTAHELSAIGVTSGANANDHTIYYQNGTTGVNFSAASQSVYFGIRMGCWMATTNVEQWVLFSNTPASYPANTHSYVGFKFISTGAATAMTLTAESCDGGGAGHTVSTDITNSVSYTQYQTADVAFRSTTGHIYFYVNGVVLADHTTHLPITNLFLSLQSKALSTAAKTLQVYTPKIVTSAPGT
jgi:hypothetical protein